MSVLVSVRHPRGRAAGMHLKKEGRRFLRALSLEPCELSVSVVTDAQIQRLNRDWRGKDRPTDVLSFPVGDSPAAATGLPRQLGDVVVSLDTARRVAAEEGVPLAAELSRYLAHGVLHLLGYDHVRARDAAKMARVERDLLGAAGMLSPRDASKNTAAHRRRRRRLP